MDLDIGALRSFLAVADHGGFRAAAAELHLAQSTVSQHVRRVELAVGAPLVKRAGRHSAFTARGEATIAAARRLVREHDAALARLREAPPRFLVVGATEHAAAHLIPRLRDAVVKRFPGTEVRFRLDRSARLVEALRSGKVDAAVLVGDEGPGEPAARLVLGWHGAPDERVESRGERSIAVVAITEPCAIRTRALRALAAAGREPRVVAESGNLAGVLDAARAGLGVALLATAGPVPSGLRRVAGLPAADSVPLFVAAHPGALPALRNEVAGAVRSALLESGSGTLDRSA